MAVSTRIIKRRIRSVGNTRKITKAMELVAASKMRKSVQMTVASRAYARSVSNIVDHVRSLVDPKTHPLLAGRAQSKHTLVIVAASDRGLCGGFNSQLLKTAINFFHTRSETVRVITVGRRAERAVKRVGVEIHASFEAISNAPSYERTLAIGTLAYTEFMAGRADRVFIVYTDFRSAISQIPVVQQLLPIIPENELNASSMALSQDTEEHISEDAATSKALFEPDANTVLDALLPRMLETQVYQALLESSASEHSARMLAMKNASDNASNMLEDLTFTFNQARQASITREISEISAGKAAIE